MVLPCLAQREPLGVLPRAVLPQEADGKPRQDHGPHRGIGLRLHELSRRRALADHRGQRRLHRQPAARLEDRAGRAGHRDRPGDQRLPAAARYPASGTKSSTAVLPDHQELARQAPDQPRDDHQPDRRHQHDHRADRHRPARHRPLPDRRQGQRPADEKTSRSPAIPGTANGTTSSARIKSWRED